MSEPMSERPSHMVYVVGVKGRDGRLLGWHKCDPTIYPTREEALAKVEELQSKYPEYDQSHFPWGISKALITLVDEE